MIKIDCLKIRDNVLADLPEIKGEAINISSTVWSISYLYKHSFTFYLR